MIQMGIRNPRIILCPNSTVSYSIGSLRREWCYRDYRRERPNPAERELERHTDCYRIKGILTDLSLLAKATISEFAWSGLSKNEA